LVLPQIGTAYEKEREKNRLTGYVALEHGWYLPLAGCSEIHGSVLFDGIGGDVLSAGLFLTEERIGMARRKDWGGLAEELMEPEGYLQTLLTAEFGRRVPRRLAKERIVSELEKHQDALNPITSFYFWNRTRRCIAVCPYRLLPADVRLMTPFMEERLVRFLLSLPPEMVVDHKFHTATIAEAYPEYADIPYEEKHRPRKHNNAYYRRYSLDILKDAFSQRRCNLTRRSFAVTRPLSAVTMPWRKDTVAYFGELTILLHQLERIADYFEQF
jgi:hypothetical protein